MIAVITTIALPTNSIRTLSNALGKDQRMIVIGDKKGPESFGLHNADFYSLKDQFNLNYFLASKLPIGHYSRKNLGYLLAMETGENCMYETDDDNAPNQLWAPRKKEPDVIMATNKSWVNVYQHFTAEKIWPRGFLLNRINLESSRPQLESRLSRVTAPIQQGLANKSPDVDAIWRLVADRPLLFENKDSLGLGEGAWCPFNTQSTWWWEEAYPLLYLPSFCSFRMTDIWKSFIAQRCIWAMGFPMVFHGPEVDQDRNEHDLMMDFEAEIPGYTQNEKLTGLLESKVLLPGKENGLENLISCYELLVKEGLFPKEELTLVYAWAKDYTAIQKNK
jgi:hypothetical protein